MKKKRYQAPCSTKTSSYKSMAEARKMARYTAKYLELPEGAVRFYRCKECKKFHLEQLSNGAIAVLKRREASSK